MADEKMDVCSADRKRSRPDYCAAEGVVHREGEGDREGAFTVLLPVDRADGSQGEEDDDDYVEITLQDLFKNVITHSEYPEFFSHLKLFVKQERRCLPEGVCKIPHVPHAIPRAVMLLGLPARQVFSITIHRNLNSDSDSGSIKIYGAVRLISERGRYVELFERSESDPIVFNNSDGKLALPLQGPNMAWAFNAEPGQTLVCLLKYNGVDIFQPLDHNTFQYGCSVFPWDDGLVVGCGMIEFPRRCPPYPGFLSEEFDGLSLTESVTSVKAGVRTMLCGMVGMIKFKALRDLSLYGKITARSCLSVRSIVLFEETRKEKEVKVKSTDLIPLSRHMMAVDSRSSLLIKMKLFDGITNENLLDETVQFNVDIQGETSTKFTSNQAILVTVDWILPEYDFAFC